METKKTINILGEDVNIKFCMAVEIAYEDITEEPFSLEPLAKVKNMLALSMACIIVNNPETSITIDRLLNEASGQDIGMLNTAVIDSMTEWLKIPKVIAEPEEKEKSPKN